MERSEKPGKIEKGITCVEIISYQKGNDSLSDSVATSVCLHDFEQGIDFNSNLSVAHPESLPQTGLPKTGKYFCFQCT